MFGLLPTGQAFAHTSSVTHTTASARPSGRQTPQRTLKHLRQPSEKNDTTLYTMRHAGYVPSGNGGYQRVSATWTVPCIASDSLAGSSSIWVGLGVVQPPGVQAGLVQAGTHQERTNAGDKYYAWVQNTGAGLEVPIYDVRCGDLMYAVVEAPNTRTPTMFIVDLSNPRNARPLSYGPSANPSTAGFIVERPRSIVNGVSTVPPLVNFGSVTFSNCTVTTTAGTVLALGQTAYDQYVMTNNGEAPPPSGTGTVLASVGPIDPFVGQSFTVAWQQPS
jgi:hypothetical protein